MVDLIDRFVRTAGGRLSTGHAAENAEDCDITFQSLVAFSLLHRGESDVLSAVMLDSGIAHSVFQRGAPLVAALARCTPDIMFLDVTPDTTETIDAMFALANARYPGAVQLICDRDLAMIDGVRLTGQRLGLQMLPALVRPFDEAAVAAILEAEGLRMPRDAPPADSLDNVLRNGWMEFWYQSKIDLRKKCLVGVEVLARVRHPRRGVLPPGPFLVGADEKSLIALNEQALVSALKAAASLSAMGARLRLAVNVSVNALRTLPVRDIIQEHRPSAANWPGLLFDVTEEQIASDIALVHDLISDFQDVGVNLAIDDYGRGGLSLGQLRALPFAELKLNRPFVTDCSTHRTKAAICQSVINLVHSIGSVAVAIGVEKASELQALQRMGCDIGQGFLFGQPMPHDRFLALVEERAIRQLPRRLGDRRQA
jgi:EAL domain-containing protein (putative c-di-GMP-specific phosphodiesterase class I)